MAALIEAAKDKTYPAEIAVVAPDDADAVLKVLRDNGESAVLIGTVVPAQDGGRVTYSGSLDL
jgi:nitrogen regulatory protein PII-like uncharacterized protein